MPIDMPIEIPKPIPDIKILDLESCDGNLIGIICSRFSLRCGYADAIAVMLKLAKGFNLWFFAVTGLEIRGRRERARGEFSKALLGGFAVKYFGRGFNRGDGTMALYRPTLDRLLANRLRNPWRLLNLLRSVQRR